jgi:hypothetical protein
MLGCKYYARSDGICSHLVPCYLGPCADYTVVGGARQIYLEVVTQRPILFGLRLFCFLSWSRGYPGSLPNLEGSDAREVQVLCVATGLRIGFSDMA